MTDNVSVRSVRLYRDAKERVRTKWGDGVAFMGSSFYRGLVAESVLDMLAGQDDEDITAQRLRILLNECTELLNSDPSFNLIIEVPQST